ncbi:MAG: SusC/RagA family TonB-linked outer membrane protein [Bacteroidetes bacterium]|nr:SusC/RagA family TonB-linked outer membrane protein [Bacteroidota bacterium]
MRKLSILLALLLFTGMQVLAQRTITGKVTSADDGLGIPGATVLVKGTTSGTLTDVDGKYQLSVPKTATTLIFQSVGMKPMEFTLGASNVIDVVLQSEAKQIEGVVVTALGITRQSRELGVSTAKVSDRQLTQAGVSNVMNGLTAKVSGLQINTINNGINPDTKITLRGNRHFLASNQALVVLDGIPISATFLNSVNPNDIESVTVLKGASASALYGNDASNGVMIVTTKKGSKQKPIINVSNTTTFEQISYLPNLQTRFGSGSGESTGNADNNYTFWIGPDRTTDPYTSYENQQYGPEYNGQMVILGGKLEDGSYQMVPYSAIKNQKKNFFNIGHSIQNDISYSGGDENSNFYLSAQDVNTAGTVPDDKNRRTSARMAAGKKYGMFGADFSMGFTKTSTEVAGGDMNQGRGVYWNVLNTPQHVPLTQYKNIDTDPFAALDGYYNAYYPNPYWQIAHSRQFTKRNDFLGSLLLTLKPLPWLEFSNRNGLTYNTVNYNDYVDEAVYSAYSKGDPWSQGHMGQQSPYSGQSSDYMSNQFNLSDDFLAKLSKDFGDFSSKLILGTSVFVSKYNQITDAASALVIPNLYNISNRVGEPVVTQTTNERRSIGAFADATFGFKNFVFLHLSGRNDWDSRLTKSNRSFFYPGADISFVLSDMIPALKDNPVLTFLKLRGSWSKTGQIAIANWYATVPSYVSGAGFPYGNIAGFRLSTTLSNPNLRPELTVEKEGGFEMTFLKNRIHFITNFYVSNTKDQTIPASISSATGFRSAYINAGELQTKGIENDLNLTPLVNLGPVAWNLSVNYTYSTSKVISIFPGLTELPIPDPDAKFASQASVSYAVVGEQFPLLKVTDVMRDPEGHIIVDPVTGLPSTNPALVPAGHGNPNHILGLVNSFTWKGLGLNIVADYRTGNNIYNEVGTALDFTGVSEHSALNGRQPFLIPNSVIETASGVYVPNTDVVVTNASRAFWVSSNYATTQRAYVTSAAFWKLREVALTYELPVKELIGTKVLKSAQIGIVGRNLLMWRPKTNVWTDPEFNNASSTGNAVGLTSEEQTPPTRVYGFSVKLTF